jgi:ElaB/YqjD/DUF883 family membrane-anchored ribosome-binding protein
MSNQISGRQSDNRPRSGDQNHGEQSRKKESGGDTRSQITEGMQSTADTAKRSASEAASTIGSHMKELLDTQLGSGANIIGKLGSSAQRAAEDLEESAPQLAGLVRGVADRMEGYAEELRDQSVDELFRSASNFTRRQPALVFGLAALAGFFALRTLKSTAPRPQSSRGQGRSATGEYHGA